MQSNQYTHPLFKPLLRSATMERVWRLNRHESTCGFNFLIQRGYMQKAILSDAEKEIKPKLPGMQLLVTNNGVQSLFETILDYWYTKPSLTNQQYSVRRKEASWESRARKVHPWLLRLRLQFLLTHRRAWIGTSMGRDCLVECHVQYHGNQGVTEWMSTSCTSLEMDGSHN